MTLAERLLPEFEQEMANTRKVLERLPDDKLDWKAHPKSQTIGWVASHLAEIAGWTEGTLTTDSWDIQPVGQEPYRTPIGRSRQEILDTFDNYVITARKAITATDDATFGQKWSLLVQGKPVLTDTKYNVLRTFILNHTVHHRAILTVYYRLNDIPVPGMYGPSGDEN